LLIYVVTEHYPSLYKPYFDTQFEQFLRDGHDVRVFAFGTGERAVAPASPLLAELYATTSYLPTGRGSLPKFSPRIAANLLGAPSQRIAALRRARLARPARVDGLPDLGRLAAMPTQAPDLCLVHNLIAAHWVRFLRDLYPGAPVGFYYHGGELPGVPEISHSAASETFAASDVVFTNTEKSKAHAISRGCPGEKIVVSPVGFNLDEFPAIAKRSYRREGTLNLVSVGRLSPEKGFNFALEAARHLVAGGFRDFRYRIVGGGSLQEALARQIEASGLRDFVSLAGPIPRSAVLEALRAADVLVLPSISVGTWEENQACVVQEAMLAQALVIASRTGGVPESLAPELRPYLVPEGDAAAIAAAVLAISSCDRSVLAALGEAGRRFVETRYDIRRLNAQILGATLATRPSARVAG